MFWLKGWLLFRENFTSDLECGMMICLPIIWSHKLCYSNHSRRRRWDEFTDTHDEDGKCRKVIEKPYSDVTWETGCGMTILKGILKIGYDNVYSSELP